MSFATQVTRRIRHVDRFLSRELRAAGSSPLLANAAPAASIPVVNPFLPTKHTRTGRWQGPKYSLRRQADIIKGAQLLALESTLPPGSKNPPIPLILKSNVKDETASALLQRLRSQQALQAPESVVAESLENPFVSKFPIKWEGEPKVRESFGLYGKRRKMFKGRKWEKEVQIRRKLTAQVVEKIKETKKNLAWSRKKSRQKPKTKLPF